MLHYITDSTVNDEWGEKSDGNVLIVTMCTLIPQGSVIISFSLLCILPPPPILTTSSSHIYNNVKTLRENKRRKSWVAWFKQIKTLGGIKMLADSKILMSVYGLRKEALSFCLGLGRANPLNGMCIICGLVFTCMNQMWVLRKFTL